MLNRRRWLAQSALGCAAAVGAGCREQQAERAPLSRLGPSRVGIAEAPRPPISMQPRGLFLNDIHSRLNSTAVLDVSSPDSLESLQQIVRRAREQGLYLSVSGGRHSMGGQQFGQETRHIDTTTSLNQPLQLDRERGLVTLQPGVQWPELLDYLAAVQADGSDAPRWTIRQKQAGVDRVTVAGSISANAHGRSLNSPPLVADVESLRMVDSSGELVTCNREENAELFSLAVGGYGLFGFIGEVVLRLTERQPVRRISEQVEAGEAANLLQQFRSQGGLMAECECSTAFAWGGDAAATPALLTRFEATPDAARDVVEPARLNAGQRLELAVLRHTDPAAAFQQYAQHRLQSSGEINWCDEAQMQRGTLPDHGEINQQLRSAEAGSEMLTELVLPPDSFPAFLESVREACREQPMQLLSALMRWVDPDEQSFLAWARQPSLTITFAMHVEHTHDGIEQAAVDARRLAAAAVQLGGGFHAPFHRWADKSQVAAAFPQIVEFLRLKLKHDPEERFQSQWYRHHKAMFAAELQA